MRACITVAVLSASLLIHLQAADESVDVDDLAKTPDVKAVAQAMAVDYPELVKLAASGNVRAFRLLAWLTQNGGFDGASSEAHAEILWRLILRFGDERASVLIVGISPDEAVAVAEAVWSVNGLDLVGPDECPQELLAKSPRVMRFLKSKLTGKKMSPTNAGSQDKP
jgi:hypothetical protein